jgi:alpha-L-arabinofuranosidase
MPDIGLYGNEPRHTYWADQRRKNGREEPIKLRLALETTTRPGKWAK